MVNYEESRKGCANELNDPDNDGGVTTINGRTCRFEDAHRIEDHRIDALFYNSWK